MIIISPEAAQKLANLKKDEGKDDSAFLRVEVKKGGCSGLSYKMDFDTVTRDGDKVFESAGQKIAVDPSSLLYILGMTLEYFPAPYKTKAEVEEFCCARSQSRVL